MVHPALQIDPSNRIILEQHLVCAAAELPLVLATDDNFFGPAMHATADTLVQEGGLLVTVFWHSYHQGG